MLSLRSLSYTYAGAAEPALSDVSLRVEAGECVCLTGDSGCGKTTFLLAMKGLLRRGTLTGAVELSAAEDRAESLPVGLVFQSAESQSFCSTVAEEVAFGPENLCVPPVEIAARVRRALDEVGLTDCWARNVERLSAGQKHRLAIAAVLSTRPRVLLLDEPTAQLDAAGKAEVVSVLRRLKGSGYALVVAEHDLAALGEVVDRFALMRRGRIEATTRQPPLRPGVRAGAGRGPATARPIAGPGACAVAATGVWLSYPGSGTVLRGVDLEVAPGERLHLSGANGCGKSTLLACLAGAIAPDAGSVTVAGRRVDARASLVGVVGYLFQNPQRQLFEETVAAEVAFSLKRLGLSPPAREDRVAEALALCEVAHLARRFPLSLSFGEQHRVALASVLATRPKVLLLDEPFAGLDLAQRHRLLSILASLRDLRGTAVILASHDPMVEPAWADRVVRLEEGALTDGRARSSRGTAGSTGGRPEPRATRRTRHRAGDYGCQFKAVDSPLHHLGAAPKLLLCAGLCAAAVLAQEPGPLAGVVAAEGALWLAARLGLADLWRDARYLALQAVLVVALHVLHDGSSAGLWPGLRIALQIALFFLPGIVFLRTTQASQLMRGLARVLPYRFSFLVFTSLRFVPLFARELSQLATAQRLRGAPLSPRDLLHPGRWRDAFDCVVLPLLVRALRVADEVALSAEGRGFGARQDRTYFDALRPPAGGALGPCTPEPMPSGPLEPRPGDTP